MTRRDLIQLTAASALPPPAAISEPPKIDFRYRPLQWQTAYCFPDDPHKSLVDDRGRLLYGNPGRRGADFYPAIVEFALPGADNLPITRQELESPAVPIVHTRIGHDKTSIELVSFATNRASEGRVDNLIVRINSTHRAAPLLRIHTRGKLAVEGTKATLDAKPFLTSSRPLVLRDAGSSYALQLPAEPVTGDILFRFPQQGQSIETADPAAVLAEARAFWSSWHPFSGGIEWQLPKPYAHFLTACARNILQAREVRNGRLTFQVGPTCYRGLWVVDGHFILEAARYLGYDKEALQGLATTWTYQRPDGALDAGGGPEHYKDAAIAMFSTVRQSELSRDWRAFDEFLPSMRRAAAFLQSRRDKTRDGLIVPGFADGGFTKGYEFTNTLWTLAGLRSVASRPGTDEFSSFYQDLRAGFETAAKREMIQHPSGFTFLPMVLREDSAWQRDEWSRPRPQAAQWALSHAIYPGVVFDPAHPVVRGHIDLMKWCSQEDVPAETGWLPHEGLWTYNAAFAAHAYLWAGEHEWARRTFHGFLNHASPLYCWREEQPLRGSLVAGYVGDMPHNWASAECVLYLRHMLALEDGSRLRLLEGIGAPEMSMREPFRLKNTPTRFGPVSLELIPEGSRWRLQFERGSGPAPSAVTLPKTLGGLRLSSGAKIDPGAAMFTATWG